MWRRRCVRCAAAAPLPCWRLSCWRAGLWAAPPPLLRLLLAPGGQAAPSLIPPSLSQGPSPSLLSSLHCLCFPPFFYPRLFLSSLSLALLPSFFHASVSIPLPADVSQHLPQADGSHHHPLAAGGRRHAARDSPVGGRLLLACSCCPAGGMPRRMHPRLRPRLRLCPASPLPFSGARLPTCTRQHAPSPHPRTAVPQDPYCYGAYSFVPPHGRKAYYEWMSYPGGWVAVIGC